MEPRSEKVDGWAFSPRHSVFLSSMTTYRGSRSSSQSTAPVNNREGLEAGGRLEENAGPPEPPIEEGTNPGASTTSIDGADGQESTFSGRSGRSRGRSQSSARSRRSHSQSSRARSQSTTCSRASSKDSTLDPDDIAEVNDFVELTEEHCRVEFKASVAGRSQKAGAVCGMLADKCDRRHEEARERDDRHPPGGYAPLRGNRFDGHGMADGPFLTPEALHQARDRQARRDQ